MANTKDLKRFETVPKRFTESVTMKPNILEEGYNGQSDYIIPKIEAIHAGKTRNGTFFPTRALKGDPAKHTGVYSWAYPYAKPVIYNHDRDSESSGRVIRAEYSDVTQAGKPGIILFPKITQPSAIQAIRDGRLLTVSIGGEAEKLTCSICGTNIIEEGMCQHEPGEFYEGVECRWEVDDVSFDELSWVNVPADSDAMVTDTETSQLPEPTPSEPTVNPSSDKTTEQSLDGTPNTNEAQGQHNSKLTVNESETQNLEEKEDQGLNQDDLKALIMNVIKEMDNSNDREQDLDPQSTVDDSVKGQDSKEEPPATDETTPVEPNPDEEEQKNLGEGTKTDSENEEEKTVEVDESTAKEMPSVEEVEDMKESIKDLNEQLVQAKIESLLAISHLDEAKEAELKEELKDLSVDEIDKKIAEAKEAMQKSVEESKVPEREKVHNPLKDTDNSITESVEDNKAQIQESEEESRNSQLELLKSLLKK